MDPNVFVEPLLHFFFVNGVVDHLLGACCLLTDPRLVRLGVVARARGVEEDLTALGGRNDGFLHKLVDQLSVGLAQQPLERVRWLELRVLGLDGRLRLFSKRFAAAAP